MSIKLMDSSVRDGGNVNDWKFGKKSIEGIISNLQRAGVNFIELGYLKNVEYDPDRTLYPTVSHAKRNLPKKTGETVFSLMVQEDKWDWNKIEPCDGTIKVIRSSFHKTDVDKGLELSRIIKGNGYSLHINPINIMGYSDVELIELIKKINDVHPDVLTIVDTFGSMSLDDMTRISAIIQNNLCSDIKICAHLHENLGLAYSLAQMFINYFENKRDIIIDASINGIGRVPGNLCMELIMSFLINERNARYNVDYIYDAIDEYIKKIKEVTPWGYEVPYALSAIYNLHRTYPEFLINKHRLKTKDIRAILASIAQSEKVIYNEKYINSLYVDYVTVPVDDSKLLSLLRNKISGHEVFVVAPGKSIKQYQNTICDNIREIKDAIVICVNFCATFIDADYYFFTNAKRLEYYRGEFNESKLIATSNLTREMDITKNVVNYKEISMFDNFFFEDSVLCLLRLLKNIGCNNINIAGFDGFINKDSHYDASIDDNYVGDEHSQVVKDLLAKYFSDVNLTFITPSIYESIVKAD